MDARDLSDELLRTAERVAKYRSGVGERPVAPQFDREAVRAALGGSLSHRGAAPGAVIDQLAEAVEPALTATVGPRFFGFVVGGSLDSATCADILATGWDQHAFNAASSPVSALVEELAGAWLKEALGLSEACSFGLTTGGQGANTAGLAAARHRVLQRAGWDVEAHGVNGAPAIRVVAGEERHATIDRALRLLGLGANDVEPVPADDNGAIDAGALARVLDGGAGAPTIVCVQAGNVNTGACDDLGAACEAAHGHDAWVHVDGAFGLWAAAGPTQRHLVAGIEQADSWAVDGHKWLNVPYDCGYVFCADPEAHAAAMSYTAAYLADEAVLRSPSDYVLESSRRARGFATWAALRELGRDGLAELVDRCCALARRFGERLAEIEGVEIGNEIVLNQALARFGSDERTDALIDAVQRDGTCWMGGTTWRGRRYMRISVSNWSTTESDVDRSVEAIRRLLAELS
ncbi:MAG TPA: pyridoxal-dependent decarboxylase [Thermoleophilaceae bacterium]|nr:pyridoxal-dependent decarboxylase [Thermoleophilaceae bacterium]